MVKNFDMIQCSKGKWRKASSRNLPHEIIFDILLMLPAHILYDVMRYVCRHWYTIIQDPQFLRKHCMMPPTTALLMHIVQQVPRDVICSPDHRMFHDFQLLDVANCDAKLTGFKFKLPHRAKVLSTCNGLLLMDVQVGWNTRFFGEDQFYVGNPVTRRTLALPPLSKFMSRPTNIHPYCYLAFAASHKVYKVLVVYKDPRFSKELSISYCDYPIFYFGCAILTVGIDKAWRVLNLTHLKKDGMKFLCDQPLSSTGFIYWAARSYPYILALDVESESIKSIPLPCAYDERSYFVPKGNSISFLHVNPDLSMEVWVLKDHKTEEWVMFSYIKGEPIINELESFLLLNELSPWSEYYKSVHPRCWLGNSEKILFHIQHYVSAFCRNGRFFVYDLKIDACTQVELQFTSICNFIPFITSLGWI